MSRNGTRFAVTFFKFNSFTIKPTNQRLIKEGYIKMESSKKLFEVKKTFGLSVLLKLTRKTIDGIEISETDGKYRSNLDLDEMNRAVTPHHGITQYPVENRIICC